jgi:glutathione-regulated potassium-efflux system ancillary protein KefC
VVGLSMALGAFLAGVLLADSEYRASWRPTSSPSRACCSGLFFIAVGMSIDFGVLAVGAGHPVHGAGP